MPSTTRLQKTNSLLIRSGVILQITMQSFGKQLQEWRERANIRQSELARRLKVSPTYVSNLERDYSPSSKSGAPQPSVELCDRIADVLEVSKEAVRKAAGYQLPTGAVDDEAEILDYWRGLPTPLREDLLTMIRAVYAKHRKSETDSMAETLPEKYDESKILEPLSRTNWTG